MVSHIKMSVSTKNNVRKKHVKMIMKQFHICYKMNIFVTHVKNTIDFVTRAINTNVSFTYVTVIFCEKFVPVNKIDHTYTSHLQICDVFVRILHEV